MMSRKLKAASTRFINQHPKGSVVGLAELHRLLAKALDEGYHNGTTDAYWDVRTNDPCRKQEADR